jgi:hypothetical protein
MLESSSVSAVDVPDAEVSGDVSSSPQPPDKKATAMARTEAPRPMERCTVTTTTARSRGVRDNASRSGEPFDRTYTREVMRRRVLMVSLPVLLLVCLVGAEQALACSCAPISAKRQFRQSDAAVIARLVDRIPRTDGGGEVVGPGSSDFVYRVKRVFKGKRRLDRGDKLTIRSSNDGASCGLPKRERRYGLFLERVKRRYTASLCSVVSPRKMRRAARRAETEAAGCR